MPNYSNGKIYRIVDNTINQQYFGSTTIGLSLRLAGHLKQFKVWKKTSIKFITSFKIIENGNYDIVLVEEFPCGNKEQLHKRERFHIENNKCVNKFIPTRTGLEYRREHTEDKQQYDLQYRTNNYETINAKNICYCGGLYKTKHKSTHFKTPKHLTYYPLDNCSEIII